jgi:enoyl-CoA hydratase/carnithine racemase
MSRYWNVELTKEGKIATIALNRPDKLNAINDALAEELMQTLREIEATPEIQVVVLKGKGPSFSVGQDLSGVGTSEVMPPDPRGKPYESQFYEFTRRQFYRWRSLLDFPRFTIAQVHGYCLGAGCDLALCCQTIIASEDAVFGDPSIRMGLAPANPLWTWRVGLKKTKELLLTGKYVDGREAERIGLVMKAVPLGKLGNTVQTEASTKAYSGTIGGFDLQSAWMQNHQSVFELAGLSAAWRLSSNLYTLSAFQRPERSYMGRGGFNFYKIRQEKGLKAAIEERDKPFESYFPKPRPKTT